MMEKLLSFPIILQIYRTFLYEPLISPLNMSDEQSVDSIHNSNQNARHIIDDDIIEGFESTDIRHSIRQRTIIGDEKNKFRSREYICVDDIKLSIMLSKRYKVAPTHKTRGQSKVNHFTFEVLKDELQNNFIETNKESNKASVYIDSDGILINGASLQNSTLSSNKISSSSIDSVIPYPKDQEKRVLKPFNTRNEPLEVLKGMDDISKSDIIENLSNLDYHSFKDQLLYLNHGIEVPKEIESGISKDDSVKKVFRGHHLAVNFKDWLRKKNHFLDHEERQ